MSGLNSSNISRISLIPPKLISTEAILFRLIEGILKTLTCSFEMLEPRPGAIIATSSPFALKNFEICDTEFATPLVRGWKDSAAIKIFILLVEQLFYFQRLS